MLTFTTLLGNRIRDTPWPYKKPRFGGLDHPSQFLQKMKSVMTRDVAVKLRQVMPRASILLRSAASEGSFPIVDNTCNTAELRRQQQQQQRRWGHTVRLIALEDLPHGKAYKGDVVTVKAGYARNYLIPQKMALYAIPQNFKRLGMVDPDIETEEQRIARLERESNFNQQEEYFQKQADTLKSYLRNKVVRVHFLCFFLWLWGGLMRLDLCDDVAL